MFWHFVESHSFCIVSGDLPKTMRKLYLSTKFSNQEMRWNYGVSALAREILPGEKNALSSEKPSELISRSTLEVFGVKQIKKCIVFSPWVDVNMWHQFSFNPVCSLKLRTGAKIHVWPCSERKKCYMCTTFHHFCEFWLT